MNVIPKILTTAFKSAILASTLLVSGLFIVEGTHITLDVLPVFLFACIITFILSVGGIIVTILPFCYLPPKEPLISKFRKYFPFYSISFFTICIIVILMTDFIIGSLLFGIAYITAMFAWTWFFKPEKNEN